ncbi:DUF4148 domain-containing protein [Noviherbaspirillum aerium]|uniref:DUF4148 domain-containing protein n=1 Tax=Noviherbaspirillum aerium TaxID=2588497 RepID=UPI00178C49BC|nr:DUF4148 domain-containing protein [Noviherbaspirillum aerium]
MNAKQLIAAVTVFAATGSAFASEWVDFSDFKSTKTRAEVIADMKQADALGQMAGNSEFVEFKNAPVASAATPDAVRQEALAAGKAKTAAAGE